jgi:nucleotide-binding universal stress UspA family protein
MRKCVKDMSSRFFEKGKILVPVDGSDYCKKALDFAINLVKMYSAEMWLVHVASYSTVLFSGIGDSEMETYSNIDDLLEKSGQDILNTCLDEVKKQGLQTKIKLLRGNPGIKIVQYVKNEGFNLIVMGSRGLSGASRFLLGSVSDYVSDNAECPVIIVK